MGSTDMRGTMVITTGTMVITTGMAVTTGMDIPTGDTGLTVTDTDICREDISVLGTGIETPDIVVGRVGYELGYKYGWRTLNAI